MTEKTTGWLSTHVLDTAQGCPAGGMELMLWKLEAIDDLAMATMADALISCPSGLNYRLLKTTRTNADGRTDIPLLEGKDFLIGTYEITFAVGDYFARTNLETPQNHPFLDIVPLRFGIADSRAHYHVPLLASPWSYSTYRGS